MSATRAHLPAPERTAFAVLAILSLCHFLNDLLQALLPAIYPMLKASFDLSYTQIGLITLTNSATSSVLQPIVGSYTDRRPRPYSLAAGMSLLMAALLILAFAHRFEVLLVGAAVLGVASAIFHPESSRIARVASGGRHGFAQSLFQTGGNLGTSIGPLLAAFIVLPRGRTSIAWFALVAFVALVLLWHIGRWYAATRAAAPRATVSASQATSLAPREVRRAIAVLLTLIFSKYVYLASLTSYYMFFLIHRFGVSPQSAQLHLFAFLGAAAAGTFIGGPLGDRFGRKYVIWGSILGVLPFTLALPYANLFWTDVLSVAIGLILASAFSAIVVYGQELMPGRVGLVAGLFFGFAFGIAGIGAAALGALADLTSIDVVYRVCAFLPALGILAVLLPKEPGRTGVRRADRTSVRHQFADQNSVRATYVTDCHTLPTMRTFLICLLLTASMLARQEPAGHDMGGPPPPARYVEPIKLFTIGLGPFTRPISSKNVEAQAFFTQGMQMMYAFAKVDAVRSFRMSWTKDPDCAICYWGEAWAWGSYLNGPMNATEAPQAWAALQKAIRLRDRAPAKEQAFIDALSVRYVEKFAASKRVDQDRAYAEAMKKLTEQYPDDLDAMTLYGDALFLLEPRRGWRDANATSVKRMLGVFEQVLAKDIHHPGACHLYIHATEATKAPGKAEACAAFLGSSIPGASHINHMPSHTYNRIGRWGDAVQANIDAWHSDQKAAIGEGFAIYPEHNLHMLAFSASFDGQGAVAIQAGKDYAKATKDGIYSALTLVRFGRFEEIPAITPRPTAAVSGGFWDFAQGYAKLRLGNTDGAKQDLEKLQKLADSSKASFRSHPAKVLLGCVAAILEGEIRRQEGNLKGAIKSFERAAKFEDDIVYDEPEPLPFSARHWLGAALLEARRPDDAERIYKEELELHPLNGWSLFGLQQALAAQGKPTAEVDKQLAAAWARSDVRLSASRY